VISIRRGAGGSSASTGGAGDSGIDSAKDDRAGTPGESQAARAAQAGQMSESRLRAGGPLGVYVHFPFCGVHCPYCDFAVDARADIPHDRYADTVIAEINARASWFHLPLEATEETPRLASIYFGGGTPGLWRPDALGRVIATARTAFCVDDTQDLEITVEANPGEVDEAALRSLREQGVNRLSLGVQSLDDRLLRAIGRNHDAAAAPAAVHAARAAGIDNLSIDLMFGLPQQSMDDWRRSIDGVLALNPDHVSAYALTIERGTPFGARARRGDLIVPDDEQAALMQDVVRDALAAAGLAQYEVSSYARAGRRAVHNGLYWTGAPYLGVGASASSFRPLSDGTGWRFSNPRATETYLRTAAATGGSPTPAQIEHRSRADLENEAVWLALRTTDGIDRVAHERRFGADPSVGRESELRACVASGWLDADAAHIRPTPTGLLFADEIATRLWRDA
jgi:oxygen-independent coproporphyrinogen-3 oxidase